MISVDGLLLENKPLSNVEIQNRVCKLGVPGFRGVYVRDNLPNKPRRSECCVLNLDDRSGKWRHWVAWHKKDGEKYYYDSYGVQPPREMVQYLQKPIFYNTENIQPQREVICGHLCLYALKELSHGRNFQQVVNDLFCLLTNLEEVKQALCNTLSFLQVVMRTIFI